MSVASRNPFALLDEDGSRPPTPPPAAPAADPPATRGSQRGRGRGGPASRGGKYYSRGGPRTSAPRDGQAADEEPVEGTENKKFDSEGRGRGRGRGRGGGRGEGRGEGRGGRRPYDRHSATGKTDSDKKIHQSWGGDDGNAELQTEQVATIDAAAEQTGVTAEDNSWGPTTTGDDAWGPPPPADDAWGAPPPATDAWAAPGAGADAAPAEGDRNEGRRGREREPEEPDNTLTLDQYLAQQREKVLTVPKLETRKINEGTEDSLWKGAIELQKKDEDEDAYFVGKTKNAPKPRAKKEEKVFLEIDAHFERPSRGGRGGRGGDRGGDRGSDRGGRGRGRNDRGGRGRPNGPSQLNVDDEKAFPSLS